MRGAIAVIVLCVAASHVSADPLGDAKAAIESSDYLVAKDKLAAALAAGTAGPEELVEIYKLSGIVAGALGDAKAATAAFTRMLALSNKAGLPPGTSPKIAKPFAEATAYFKSHEAIAAKVDTVATPPSVTLVVASDPLAMIATVKVFVGDATFTGKPGEAIALPAKARLDLRVAGLDASGNRVVEIGTRDVPIVIVSAVAPAEPAIKPTTITPNRQPGKGMGTGRGTPEPRPIYLAWWLYGGIAVVAAGGATYFGLAARSASDDLAAIEADSVHHPRSDAVAAEDRARRDILFANIGFAAAGAFAIVSGVLFATRPHAITVEPTPTGAVAKLEVHF